MSSPYAYDPLWQVNNQLSSSQISTGLEGTPSRAHFNYDPSFNYDRWNFTSTTPQLTDKAELTFSEPLPGSSPRPQSAEHGVTDSVLESTMGSSDLSHRYNTRSVAQRQEHPRNASRPASSPRTAGCAAPCDALSSRPPTLASDSSHAKDATGSGDTSRQGQGKKRKRHGGRREHSSASPIGTSATPPATTSKRAAAAAKVAEVAMEAPLPAPVPIRSQRRGGRRRGVTNFSATDVNELLRLVRTHLPIGQYGWQRVTAGYNAYASSHGRPTRDVQSLRTKYYKLVNMAKPTGDPECPPEVREAKRIEREIDQRVCLGVIDDIPIPAEWEGDRDASPESNSDIGDEEAEEEGGDEEGGGDIMGIGSDHDGDYDTRTVKRRKIDVAEQGQLKEQPSSSRAEVVQRHRQRAGTLLTALENHLNPQARAERETARDQSRLQRLEFLANVLASRDDRAEVRDLRRRVEDLTQELTEARLENLRLQNELRMTQMMFSLPYGGWTQPMVGVSDDQQSGYAHDVADVYGVPM